MLELVEQKEHTAILQRFTTKKEIGWTVKILTYCTFYQC